MGHGQRDNIIILQEGLNRNDDGVTAQEKENNTAEGILWIFSFYCTSVIPKAEDVVTDTL